MARKKLTREKLDQLKSRRDQLIKQTKEYEEKFLQQEEQERNEELIRIGTFVKTFMSDKGIHSDEEIQSVLEEKFRNASEFSSLSDELESEQSDPNETTSIDPT